MKNGPDKYTETDFPQEEVFTAISKGIQEGKGRMDHKNHRTVKKASRTKNLKRRILYTVSAASVAFGLFTGTAYLSPAFASVVSELPIIGSIFNESGRIGLQQASDQELTNTIGKTQTNDGTSITIDEVLYDKSRLTIGYSLESEEALGEHYLSSGPTTRYKINGESPDGSSGSHQETIHSPTSRTGIMEFNIGDEHPDTFNFNLLIEAKDGKQWDFSFPVETIEGLKKFSVNHNQTAGGIDLHVSDMSISPSGMGLNYETVSPAGENRQTAAQYLEFRITDGDGEEITSHSGGSSRTREHGKIYSTGNKLFDPIGEDVKTLTITPYLKLPSDGGGVAYDEDGSQTILNRDVSQLEEVEFEPFTVELP